MAHEGTFLLFVKDTAEFHFLNSVHIQPLLLQEIYVPHHGKQCRVCEHENAFYPVT